MKAATRSASKGTKRVLLADKECSVEGCIKPQHARTVCLSHYGKLLRSGALSSGSFPATREMHGGGGSRLYNIWQLMKDRCCNANSTCYHSYGGRGISFAPEWESFVAFRAWAEENGYSDDLTIDRIDVNGNYEPSNCRWATWDVQRKNRRASLRVRAPDGAVYDTVRDASRATGINYITLYYACKQGRGVGGGSAWEILSNGV